ncbi:MAG: serine protease [Arthrobacter sp.]|nr:serine protease [Arthrobacter sp.]MCU1547842.1 serine protease [Arthrobacter sp.]
MFSQDRRQASKLPLASMAAGARRYRPKSATHRPVDGSLARGLLGGLASLVLAAGGGILAAPPAGAEAEHSYIVVLKDTVADAGATAAAHQSSFGFTTSKIYRHAVSGYAATMSAADANRLAADPGVDFVTASRTFAQPRDPEPPSTQNSPFWGKRIGNKGPADVDVNVAVIDSGIDGTHPDLKVQGGVDCTSGSPVTETPVDVHGHGTSVAGVIGARNNGLGVIGTAPGTPLWSVRVVDDSGGISEESLICAIDWVTSTRKDEDRSNDIEVANISIGGPGKDTSNCGKGTDPMHYAICRSVKAGVVYAVAAGNDGSDFAGTVPATYDQVLTAAAMGDFDGQPGGMAAPWCGAQDWGAFEQRDDGPAFFSNFATESEDKDHTVAAPGVCMLSTAPGGYSINHGTSFASPAVAGSVALCISRGECKGSGRAVMEKFLDVTAAYNKNNRDYGFTGDPFRPIKSEYYGYLTQVDKF